MAHTLEASIGMPVIFGTIILLISAGPVLYTEVNRSAEFYREYATISITNNSTIKNENITLEDEDIEVIVTSPEMMHFYSRAVSDSLTIVKNSLGG